MKNKLLLLLWLLPTVGLAQNLKISQLPLASTPLGGTELVPIVQDGVTKQTTVGQIGAVATVSLPYDQIAIGTGTRISSVPYFTYNPDFNILRLTDIGGHTEFSIYGLSVVPTDHYTSDTIGDPQHVGHGTFFALADQTSTYTFNDSTFLIGGVTYNFPITQGAANSVLTNDGSGNLKWMTASGGGSGTVTSFSSGNLSPVFTTSVTNASSTPALSYILSNAGAETILGNNSVSSAVPAYFAPSLASALFADQGTTTTILHGNASGNPSWAQIGLTTDVTGVLAIANGGTGQTTANSALNALLPSQTGNSGYFLTTNGTSASWSAVSGGTPSLNDSYIGYGSSGNTLTGNNNFTYDPVAGTFYLNFSTIAMGINEGSFSVGDVNNEGNHSVIQLIDPGKYIVIRAENELYLESPTLQINGVAYNWPSSQGTANTYLQNDGNGNLSWGTASGGSGTVTSFSSGSLSPLFTTSVTNATSTPSLSYTLTNAGAETILGNNSGSSAVPAYFAPSLSSALFANQGTTTSVLHGNASGNPSWAQVGLSSDVTGTLPIINGGTGQTTANAALNALLPSQSGNANEALITNGTSASWGSIPAPSGSRNEIYYNNGRGGFGTSYNFIYDTVGGILNITVGGNEIVGIGGSEMQITENGSGWQSQINLSNSSYFEFINPSSHLYSGILCQDSSLRLINNNHTTQYTWYWPIIDGSSEQFLSTDGTGKLKWSNALPSQTGQSGNFLTTNGTTASWSTLSGSGTVTSITFSSPLTGGTITTSGTIGLGTVGISNGGTGQTTASGAINALVPSQSGNSGKYLTTNGTSVSWSSVSGGGGETIYQTNVTITPSQIATGNSSPILAIAAPGAGKYIHIINIDEDYVFNTTPYTTANLVTFVINSNNITQDSGATINEPNNASEINIVPGNGTGMSFSTGSLNDILGNQPLYVEFSTDDSSGDGTVTEKIWYTIDSTP